MPSKIRNYGTVPPKDLLPRCEACGTLGQILWSGYSQCPECGRYVCQCCWDSKKGMCFLCSKEIPSKDTLDMLKKEMTELHLQMNRLHEEMNKLRNPVIANTASDPKTDYIRIEKAVKECPKCKSEIASDCFYCYVCGARLEKV